MISLVKIKNRRAGKQLISKKGSIEVQSAGVLIKFPTGDERKPSYTVLMDVDDVNLLVNDLLMFLKE